MKLRVKTLKDPEPKDWEIDPKDSVKEVKVKLQNQWPEFESSLLRLVCAGKVLKDEDVFEELKLPENPTLVVMVTKSKPPPAQLKSEDASSSGTGGAARQGDGSSAQSQADTSGKAASAGGAGVTAPAEGESASQGGGGGYTGAASAFAAGTELEGVIATICEMGYERAQVEAALRAAFNNPDRAVEYLVNGVPPLSGGESGAVPPVVGGGSDAGPVATPPQPAMPGEGGSVAPRPGFPGSADSGPGAALEMLRHLPQFQAIRAIIQRDPSQLSAILQHVAQENPQLHALINSHPDHFLRLLSEGGPEGNEGDGVDGGHQGERVVIHLTPAEQQSIQNLEALGFSRDLAVEAFLACDKNEELAANYLFENANEFSDEMDGDLPGGEV